jgi:hypothetical protein
MAEREGIGSIASATSFEFAVRAVAPTAYCTLAMFRIIVPGGVTCATETAGPMRHAANNQTLASSAVARLLKAPKAG